MSGIFVGCSIYNSNLMHESDAESDASDTNHDAGSDSTAPNKSDAADVGVLDTGAKDVVNVDEDVIAIPDATPDATKDATPDATKDAAKDATEADTSEPDSGHCDLSCNLDNASSKCEDGECKIDTCIDDYYDCNEDPSDGCEATLNTATNCGECNAPCEPIHAWSDCSSGTCQLDECYPGYANCDGDTSNGCEASLTSLTHCGKCNTPCDKTSCAGGVCTAMTCTDGMADCDGDDTSCETSLNTNDNCILCDRKCEAENSSASCETGSCVVTSCNEGFTDCNHQPNDGCEAELASDPLNCGTCGNLCGSTNTASSVCSEGSCVLTCATGYDDCDEKANNGCEGDLLNDVKNCNECDAACVTHDNSTPVCDNGGCKLSCDTNYDDCDKIYDTGCEVNLKSDANNCNKCGTVCATYDHSTPVCNNGGCDFSCATNYDDCNHQSSDGCEAYLPTDTANCGQCGVNCASLSNVLTAACPSGACSITSCILGYKNCNFRTQDGCEHDLANGDCWTVPTLSVGYEHACAVSGSGRVACWGDGSYGELGYGATVDYRRGTIYVKNLYDATQVSDGGTQSSSNGSHGCALRSNGHVACWGRNNVGQLGNGNTSDSSTPVDVTGITTAVQVAAGQDFSCALLDNGEVSCWGEGGNGRLGNGSSSDQHSPVTVVAGETGSGNLEQVVSIGLGWGHACAVLGSGNLVCWGLGGSGQLGNNGTGDSTSPVYVHGVSNPGTCTSSNQSGCLSNVTMVAGGQDVTVAIHGGGLVSSWGSNTNGESGNGNSGSYPRRVTGVGNSGTLDNATWVSMGQNHGCAVRTSGQAACWGAGGNGRLGNSGTSNSNFPVAVSGATDYRQISAGYDSSCGMHTDGSVTCWGENNQGQVGDGTTNDSSVPRSNDHGLSYIRVDGGAAEACGVTSSGSVYCWGYPSNGDLGNGATNETWSPVKVSGITTATDVAVGHYMACAVLSNGRVNCWGYGSEGQMGNGPPTNGTNSTPVQVSSLTTATQITAGYRHFCALTSGNTVYCWGWNANGQLGDNSTTSRSTPVQVVGVGGSGNLTDAVALGAGTSHTCAVRSGGTVACWGYNGYGQLGNNNTSEVHYPVTVVNTTGSGSLSGMASGKGAIDGGYYHTCALASGASGGKAYCWGLNNYGQLGNNSTSDVHYPVQVSTITDFIQISTGLADHSCGLRFDNSVYCWGYNSSYAIGDGSNNNRSVPTAVNFATAVTNYGNTDFNSPVVFVGTGASGTDNLSWSVSYAVHQNGAVSAWGNNNYGERGNGWNIQDGVPAEVSPTVSLP
jgi:alpha-tubulin suppressor-like RCC1 family protein